MTTLRRILTGAALVVMASGLTQQLAKADIITTLVSDFISGTGTCTAAAGTYCYIYNVSLTTGEEIGTNPGWAEFGTLYDISTTPVSPIDLTGDLANSSLFSLTTSTSFTSAHLTSPSQTPGYYSLRYTYVDEGSPITGLPTSLGDFEIDSTAPPTSSTGGYYDGQATDTSNGNENGNIGELTVPGVVPVIPPSTPEPTTMALMGGALLGLGLIGKRLKKS